MNRKETLFLIAGFLLSTPLLIAGMVMLSMVNFGAKDLFNFLDLGFDTYVMIALSLVLGGVGLGSLFAFSQRLGKRERIALVVTSTFLSLMPTAALLFPKDGILYIGASFFFVVATAIVSLTDYDLTGIRKQFSSAFKFVKTSFLIMSVVLFLITAGVVYNEQTEYQNTLMDGFKSIFSQTAASSLDLSRDDIRGMLDIPEIDDDYLRGVYPTFDDLTESEQEFIREESKIQLAKSVDEQIEQQYQKLHSEEGKMELEKQAEVLIQKFPGFQQVNEYIFVIVPFMLVSEILFLESFILAPIAGITAIIIGLILTAVDEML